MSSLYMYVYLWAIYCQSRQYFTLENQYYDTI